MHEPRPLLLWGPLQTRRRAQLPSRAARHARLPTPLFLPPITFLFPRDPSWCPHAGVLVAREVPPPQAKVLQQSAHGVSTAGNLGRLGRPAGFFMRGQLSGRPCRHCPVKPPPIATHTHPRASWPRRPPIDQPASPRTPFLTFCSLHCPCLPLHRDTPFPRRHFHPAMYTYRTPPRRPPVTRPAHLLLALVLQVRVEQVQPDALRRRQPAAQDGAGLQVQHLLPGAHRQAKGAHVQSGEGPRLARR